MLGGTEFSYLPKVLSVTRDSGRNGRDLGNRIKLAQGLWLLRYESSKRDISKEINLGEKAKEL